jgi:hypothetical protein
MSFDIARWLSSKFVETIIVGQALPLNRAHEVLRRTVSGFRRSNPFHPHSPQLLTLRQQLGFPSTEAPLPMSEWTQTWGSIDLDWLSNHHLLNGTGWCWPDGSIVFAGELEDYPLGRELLDDCRRIAAAFPDLAMDVAFWGYLSPYGYRGCPLMEAPRSPWPQDFLDSVAEPSAGIMIGDGRAEAVDGSDSRLFERFGLPYAETVERAIHQFRAHEHGLPDAVLQDWIRHARTIGLA